MATLIQLEFNLSLVVLRNRNKYERDERGLVHLRNDERDREEIRQRFECKHDRKVHRSPRVIRDVDTEEREQTRERSLDSECLVFRQRADPFLRLFLLLLLRIRESFSSTIVY